MSGDIALRKFQIKPLFGNIGLALATGAGQAQVNALMDWENSKEFNDQERAVLRYTDEVSQDIRASDDTFSKIREFLTEQEIIELTVTIGYYGMVCRTLESLRIELEHE